MHSLVGAKFGLLTVIALSDRVTFKSGQRRWRWLCLCDCRKTTRAYGNDLRSGHTTSCGCRKGRLLHGHARGYTYSPEYRSWTTMKARCSNPASHAFHRYGGRGIRVCERWAAFENFLADMGSRPNGTSLERRDNDGDYEPSNCYWATRVEQMNNTCTNVFIEHKGERLTIAQWADRLGVSRSTLGARLKRGWSPRQALFGIKRNHLFTPEQRHAIRNDSRTQRAIAAEHGITQSAVSRIKAAPAQQPSPKQ